MILHPSGRSRLAAGALALAALACGRPAAPDLVLVDGRVFTADSAWPWAEAVAIAGDRILAVGSSAEVLALAGPSTRRVALEGRLVLPGFNDAHAHLDDLNPGVNVPAGSGPAPDPALTEVVGALRAAAARHPDGTWLQVTVGERIQSDRAARRAALDRVAPRHPVMLSAWTGHGVVLNSAALAALAITEPVADPPGGRFDRDAAGRLTGLVEEYAIYAVVAPALGRLRPDSTVLAALRDRAAQASALGITSLQAMLFSLEPARAGALLGAADLPVRVRLIRGPTAGATRLGTEWDGVSLRGRDTVSGSKWVLDGTPVERLAAVRAAYADRPGWYGRVNLAPDTLRAVLADALARNDQPLFHAVGDSAIALLLATMESLAPDTAWRRLRVRIEHGDGAEFDLIPRLARHGVMVVQNPTHFTLGAAVPARFGRDRAAAFQPLRSLLEAGVPVALGGDGPLNPFLNLMLAVIHPGNPPEALSLEQAIVAYTRGAAWGEGREQEKGTLAPGMLADLTVLSQDLFTVPPDQWPATTSVLTVLGGRVVHDVGVLSPAP